MKKGAVIFLRAVIVLVGIGAFAFMLLEPRFEGRNARATFFQIYFNDLFLPYAYTAFIAFFVALYQAFMLLGYIGKNKAFSSNSTRSVRAIRYCATIIIAFVVPAVIYLVVVRPGDDIAGGIFMGFIVIFASLVTVAAMDVFERVLHSAGEKEQGEDTINKCK